MVTTVTATDRDKDIVTYYFRRPNGEFTSDTPEFHLDPNSGIITTKKPLDREDTPSYTVRLGQYTVLYGKKFKCHNMNALFSTSSDGG